jgi:hypothetical protein
MQVAVWRLMLVVDLEAAFGVSTAHLDPIEAEDGGKKPICATSFKYLAFSSPSLIAPPSYPRPQNGPEMPAHAPDAIGRYGMPVAPDRAPAGSVAAGRLDDIRVMQNFRISLAADRGYGRVTVLNQIGR